MTRLSLLMRRLAGLSRSIVGGRRARRRLEELHRVDLAPYVNRIVSDAVLLNEIPSPSDAESGRMSFIVRRLRDFGVSKVVTDKAGNVLALFPAFGARSRFLLLFAEVGDASFSPLGNSVALTAETARGHGIAESSAGAAALLVLAEYAQATGYYLDKNLLLLFTPSASIDEDSRAFRGFLSQWRGQICGGLYVRGSGLGIIETRPVGTYWLSFELHRPECELLEACGPSVASALGAIASQIGNPGSLPGGAAIVSVARMQAGIGYGHWATEGTMDLEILSEEESLLEATKDEVIGRVREIAATYEANATISTRAHHSVGDLRRNARMSEIVRETLTRLGLEPERGIIAEKVAMLNELGIPGVALGITRGKVSAEEEHIELSPIENGFRQLLLVTARCAAEAERREVAMA